MLLYSITSSARSRIDVGTSSLSALVVLRLKTNSNRVDCASGKSAGLSLWKSLCSRLVCESRVGLGPLRDAPHCQSLTPMNEHFVGRLRPHGSDLTTDLKAERARVAAAVKAERKARAGLSRTIKLRIYPSEEQAGRINRTIGTIRFVWNTIWLPMLQVAEHARAEHAERRWHQGGLEGGLAPRRETGRQAVPPRHHQGHARRARTGPRRCVGQAISVSGGPPKTAGD
jgi:hypothetical protein